jgi:DNA-binding response OmpR family regulator
MANRTSKPFKAKVLWIEGRWSGHPDFIPALRDKGCTVEVVSTGKMALKHVKEEKHDFVVVDAASMRTSGIRICKSLREEVDGLPILLIADSDRKLNVKSKDVNVILELPFTPRKLINRIIPFLPGEGGNVIKAGPIKLDLERKQVQCYSKKTSLTPRMIELLQIFIERKGQVVEREELFKTVWSTEYVEDTRTLDVHISWLRQAIEENPRQPKLLKTMRGVGYRLDV